AVAPGAERRPCRGGASARREGRVAEAGGRGRETVLARRRRPEGPGAAALLPRTRDADRRGTRQQPDEPRAAGGGAWRPRRAEDVRRQGRRPEETQHARRNAAPRRGEGPSEGGRRLPANPGR